MFLTPSAINHVKKKLELLYKCKKGLNMWPAPILIISSKLSTKGEVGAP